MFLAYAPVQVWPCCTGDQRGILASQTRGQRRARPEKYCRFKKKRLGRLCSLGVPDSRPKPIGKQAPRLSRSIAQAEWTQARAPRQLIPPLRELVRDALLDAISADNLSRSLCEIGRIMTPASLRTLCAAVDIQPLGAVRRRQRLPRAFPK
jgi:hypothetical protein